MDVGRQGIYVPIAQVVVRGHGSQQVRAKEETEDWGRWEARNEVDSKEASKEEKEASKEVVKESAGKRAEAKAVEAKAGRKADASFAKGRTTRTNVRPRPDT